MMNSLTLINFPAHIPLSFNPKASAFVLKTCQRTLVISLEQESPISPGEVAQGSEAYQYLLEIICGLKSKLLGENEIVNQFKLAYKDYTVNPERDTKLMLVLEKLFKDAKSIRSEYLMGIAQKTYASLTRKIIYRESRPDAVLILGTGQLAEDLINQFKKKCKVFITGRNSEKLMQLCKTHNIDCVPFDDKTIWANFPAIANTIGFEGVLLDEFFFHHWKLLNPQGVFIDLGSPSTIQSHLSRENKVFRLEDIFKEGAVTETVKAEQISKARVFLNELAQRRFDLLNEARDRQVNYAL